MIGIPSVACVVMLLLPMRELRPPVASDMSQSNNGKSTGWNGRIDVCSVPLETEEPSRFHFTDCYIPECHLFL